MAAVRTVAAATMITVQAAHLHHAAEAVHTITILKVTISIPVAVQAVHRAGITIMTAAPVVVEAVPVVITSIPKIMMTMIVQAGRHRAAEAVRTIITRKVIISIPAVVQEVHPAGITTMTAVRVIAGRAAITNIPKTMMMMINIVQEEAGTRNAMKKAALPAAAIPHAVVASMKRIMMMITAGVAVAVTMTNGPRAVRLVRKAGMRRMKAITMITTSTMNMRRIATKMRRIIIPAAAGETRKEITKGGLPVAIGAKTGIPNHKKPLACAKGFFYGDL